MNSIKVFVNSPSDIAGYLVAGATFVLAVVTAIVVWQNRGIVRSANREAKAAEDLAIETRNDRDYRWRPQLEVMRYDGPLENRWTIGIRNTVDAVAIRTVVLVRDQSSSAWGFFVVGNVTQADGVRTSQVGFWEFGGTIAAMFDGFANCPQSHVVEVVMVCSDVLGRRMRFGYAVPKTSLPTTTPTGVLLGPEIEPRKATVRPPWVDQPRIWGI